MNEETSKLPEIRTFEETALDELKPYLLDPKENYPEPFYMLEFNGVPFSAIGGIQAISGQKKNGKSFVLTQLMAAILGQGSTRAEFYLQGLRVPDRTLEHIGHLPKVLYVDTEMEKLNSAKVLRRVHWLCEWDMNEPNDRFNILWLRTVEQDDDTKEKAYEKRFRLIRKAIEALEPDIVFIDGIRDIIGDFNNINESADLIQKLMAIAEKRHICIWNALHFNPRPGNDDESKMRGHTGTELGNKVTDTLVSIKKKTDTGVIFTVKQQDARSKDIPDWRFEVTDDAGALGIPKIIANGLNLSTSGKDTSDTPEDIKAWLTEGQLDITWPATLSDIRGIIKKRGGISNNDRLQNDITIAKNRRFILAQTKDKWEPGQLKPKYYLDTNQITVIAPSGEGDVF